MSAEDNLNERQFSVSLKTPGGSRIERTQTAATGALAYRKMLMSLRAEGYSRQAHQWASTVRRVDE